MAKESVKTKIFIYEDLKHATIDNNVGRDKTKMTVYFDDVDVEGYIDDSHKVTFWMGSTIVCEVEILLKDVIIVGFNKVLRYKVKAMPNHFISINAQKRIENDESTYEEELRKANPEMGEYIFS